MGKGSFAYTTYIASTPSAVWRALTDPNFTRKYWGHENHSDWMPGSRWEHRRADDPTLVDLAGTVLESAAPHRLVLSWGLPADSPYPQRLSRVAFEIRKERGATRLDLLHDELEAESETLRGVRSAWPRVLASLKTLLECGRALPES